MAEVTAVDRARLRQLIDDPQGQTVAIWGMLGMNHLRQLLDRVEALEQERESYLMSNMSPLEQRQRDIIAVLQTQVAALEAAVLAILYASDQCVGHRDCGHSMDPWKNARKLVVPDPA